MISYLALAVSPLIISTLFRDLYSIDPEKRNTAKKSYLFFCGLIIFLFLALRSRYIGSTDTLNYYNMMKDAIKSGSWESYYEKGGVEKGFQFFTYALSRVFKSPQMIIAASSAVYVISICYTVYHNSVDAAFSLTMYITLGLMQFHMQGMRQSIAMCICLFAFEFAKKRKLIPFILIVLLAMQFHRTAIVFLIGYLLCGMKYTTKNLLLIFIGAVAAFSMADKIVNIANVAFDSQYGNSVSSGGFVAALVYILIIAFAFISNKKMNTDINESSILYITLVGAVCYLLRFFGTLAAERISFYFMFGQFLLFPNSFEQVSDNDNFRRNMKFIAYILMIGLFAYRLSKSSFLPYRFFR